VWSEDFWRWMYGSSIFALIHELDDLEHRDPEHPNVRRMNMILIRRLEAPYTPTK
jgi:hypothetical protein